MKLKMKVAIALVSIIGITSCGNFIQSPKQEITMYLWDKSMDKELTPYLKEKFPDVKFNFILGYNTMDYYTDLSNRGAMPDILTCRRFSINDANHLSDQLLDLSKESITGTFYNSFIENNRETDGGIRWLPMCAEVDGFMVNLDLFAKHNIPIPTNYSEFKAVCDQFENLGIRCFKTDYKYDYTCLEIMQGCAIKELVSLDGTAWRSKYENESDNNPVGLDSKIWPEVFKKYEKFLNDTYAEPNDVSNGFSAISTSFTNGQLPIMRGTSTDSEILNKLKNMNTAILPFFGETESDNWLLTYPLYQVAVNKKVGDNKAKHDLVMKILETMFSKEGQKKSSSGSPVLSYNKNVNLGIGDSLRFVKNCIESNHLYMRLASTEFFSVSKTVGQKVIAGLENNDYTPEMAYNEFNDLLLSTPDSNVDEEILNQEIEYIYKQTNTGNKAASSLLNTIRAAKEFDLAIGYTNIASTSIFKGSYTAQQLYWLLCQKSIPRWAEYSSTEIKQYLEWLINSTEEGNNPIRHNNLMPVTSGFEYKIKDNKDGTYTLMDITINGKKMDDNEIYKVLLIGDDTYVTDTLYCNCPQPQELIQKRNEINVNGYSSNDLILESAYICKQFLAPTNYLQII